MSEDQLITEEYLSQLDFEKAQSLEVDGKFAEAEEMYRELLKQAKSVGVQDSIMLRIQKLRSRQDLEDESDAEDAKGEFSFEVSARKFSDIIGYRRHKRILKRIIGTPVTKADAYDRFKLAKSTGIIFYGAPGTGKTILAKAVSGELGIPIATIKVSEILSKHVGESEKKIAIAFKEAKAEQPSIIFFDEIDVLGMSRDKTSSEGTGAEIRSTITELLTQISDLYEDHDTKVFVVGATNLPWDVDTALTRSGRIEHFIYMKPPSFADRKRIFDYYLENNLTMHEGKYAFTNNWLLAAATARYSAADIEKVVKMAKLRVIDEGKRLTIRTRDIQRILRDRDFGRSSLDEWYQKVKHAYISTEKTSIQRTGFMGLRRQKTKTKEEGKLNKAELKIYKPMINDIRSRMRWWGITSLGRYIAKVI